jgi:elongation factor G
MSQVVFGEMKLAKQIGGRAHYGHVRLRVTVDDGVQGVVFRNALVGDTIPARFLPSIESGVLTCAKDGVLKHHGYADVRIELCDGSWHDTDSTPVAFFLATAMALEDAVRQLPRQPRDGDSDDDDGPGVRMPRVPAGPALHDTAQVAEPQ